jgi:hypothetical protein
MAEMNTKKSIHSCQKQRSPTGEFAKSPFNPSPFGSTHLFTVFSGEGCPLFLSFTSFTRKSSKPIKKHQRKKFILISAKWQE